MGNSFSRRQFFKKSAISASAAIAPYFIPAAVMGKSSPAPSEKLTLGAIGVGSQGMLNLRNFLSARDVQVTALCDVKPDHLAQAKSAVDAAYGNSDCATYRDFREVIARDDIDLIFIGTPDHWHAVMSIMAAKAGKDIYCEKPISLTIAEGRAVADAMKRYGTVYQSGTQRRSIENYQFAVRAARRGLVGKINKIVCNLGPPLSGGDAKPTPIPEGFDYDMWLGPAPRMPYSSSRCGQAFRYIFDYSGGTVTDIGAHFVDLAQWGNDSELTGPVKFQGRVVFPDSGLFNTPTDYEVEATYASGVKLIFNSRFPEQKNAFRITFFGDDGWVYTDDDGEIDAEPKSILKIRRDENIVFSKGIREHYYDDQAGHHRNFINAVKSRGQTISPPEISHRSTTVCHIGNICLRLGRPVEWDPKTEHFVNDPEADRMMSRTMRAPWHL